MLDIQFIRDNPKLVMEKADQKGYSVDIPRLLQTDDERRNLLAEIERVRSQRNNLAEACENQRPTDEQARQGKDLKKRLNELENLLKEVSTEYAELLHAVPNVPLDYVPVGTTEDENLVIKTVGKPRKFDYTPRHDYQIGKLRDFIDKERAAKVTGSRFAYLKGDLVRLQFAIVQFVIQALSDERIIQKLVEENNLSVSTRPFIPILPPAMLRTEPYRASARLNAKEVTYKIDQDDVWLNASAEHTLCTMYWNEVLPEEMFPIRYLGYATSFRREAGTYGKDVEGIFRLHQFDKMEIESFTTPETGAEEHKLHIALQEYLMQQIGLPYQLLQKCTADIGKPNAAGVDINCWFPGQGMYRETHTADYMTDYQSRDLKIRVKRTNSNATELVHTADATAFAMSRILKAILENFQTADGYVSVPDVLRPYIGGKEKI